MNGHFSHREYYAQFVTDEIKKLVLRTIGKDRIIKSTDEHLNDIQMKLWDSMAGATMRGSEVIWFAPCAISSIMAVKFKDVGDGYSLANAVCVLKEAAKQIKESNK